MRRSLQWLALVGLVTASCSTAGGRADFELRKIPGTNVFASEADFASTVIGDRYRVLNNPWNKGATTGRYRQKIFVNEENGKPVIGWAWKWRDSSGVATYPEVQVGTSPWNGQTGDKATDFPFEVGTKGLIATYDISLEASGSYNMAFEFWTVAALPPSKDTITHEVMIWIAGERLGAAGDMVGKATIDGNTYSVFLRKNHGDASGNNQNTWTIVSLLADKPILHGPLDVGHIIDHLLKNGLLRAGLYVANLELGNEVERGSGTTIIRNYDVRVQ